MIHLSFWSKTELRAKLFLGYWASEKGEDVTCCYSLPVAGNTLWRDEDGD